VGAVTVGEDGRTRDGGDTEPEPERGDTRRRSGKGSADVGQQCGAGGLDGEHDSGHAGHSVPAGQPGGGQAAGDRQHAEQAGHGRRDGGRMSRLPQERHEQYSDCGHRPGLGDECASQQPETVVP
jgi:hypothetical protein